MNYQENLFIVKTYRNQAKIAWNTVKADELVNYFDDTNALENGNKGIWLSSHVKEKKIKTDSILAYT